MYGGDKKGVESNGDVAWHCVLMQGNRYISTKCILFQSLITDMYRDITKQETVQALLLIQGPHVNF